jgi:hypothetical protein
MRVSEKTLRSRFMLVEVRCDGFLRAGVGFFVRFVDSLLAELVALVLLSTVSIL